MSEGKLSELDLSLLHDTAIVMPVSVESVLLMVGEIRDHRARALSAEDRWHLAQIRNCIDTERHDAGVLFELIDRLIAGGGE